MYIYLLFTSAFICYLILPTLLEYSSMHTRPVRGVLASMNSMHTTAQIASMRIIIRMHSKSYMMYARAADTTYMHAYIHTSWYQLVEYYDLVVGTSHSSIKYEQLLNQLMYRVCTHVLLCYSTSSYNIRSYYYTRVY